MLSFDLSYQWLDFKARYQAEIEPGVTCILGPSGGGKSTLLSLLGGYIRGEGELLFSGGDFNALLPYERPISTLFQSDNLFPQLNVWHNVAIGVAPSRNLSEQQRIRVKQAIEQVQLTEHQAKFPSQLSGGQAQRVAVARVLARKQPILLLDEPFSALDPRLRDEMLQLIADLTQANDWTTIMVTHSPQDALMLGGKVLLVESGEILAQNDAKVLRDTPTDSPFFRYLGHRAK